MDRTEFLGKMLAKGKITKEQHDTAIGKLQDRQEAIAQYKSKGATMLKGDLIKLIDKLT